MRRTRQYATIKRIQSTVTTVADCPKPVIAAVHGYCIGGGVDLITACDIRLASADALSAAIATHAPGDSVRIGYTDSSGASHTVTVTLTEGPAD